MFKTSEKSLVTNINNIVASLFVINLFGVMVFMRSFVGIYIFGIQLGKIYTGLSLLVCLLLSSKKIFFLFFNEDLNNLRKSLQFVTLSFFVVVLINRNFTFDLSSLRNSSFVWSIGYFFIGYYLVNRINKYYLLAASSLVLFASYFITFINYPNFIMDFFISFGDKFQFIKAADTLLLLIVFNFLVKKMNFDTKFEFITFLFTLSLFYPYFFVQSRGSVLGALIYFLFNLYSYRRYIINNYFRSLILIIFSGILFYGSSFLISGISYSDEYNPESIQEVNEILIDEVVTKKDVPKGFLTFYFADGRIHSYDNTTNWRLDIWQDLVEDLYKKNKILFGLGYEGIFEIMLDPTAPGRLGRDGLNENVHNYFMNIFGRGGIFQLSIFLYLYLNIYRFWKQKGYSTNSFYTLILPLLVVSSLDVTMEGVQFPLIFFSFLGYYVSED
mgnify:FL=1|tara:strand:+ start:1445 stop:2770 length:1326 start_codon:yes stop_codon:yes gene_type:complete